MWTNFCALRGKSATKQVSVFFVLLLLFQSQELQSQASSPESVLPPARPELVVLMDINADQEKVFAVEQSLALKVVHTLGDERFSLSLISFGAGRPSEIKSNVGSGEILKAIRDLTLEAAVRRRNIAPPEMYEALLEGQAAFSHDAQERAILVISGGRDDLDGKRFKQIRSGFRAQNIVCHAAVVSGPPLYGTKGIQERGFYLHDLAAKTHGKYVEVGKSQRKVQAAVRKLVDRILQGEEPRVR